MCRSWQNIIGTRKLFKLISISLRKRSKDEKADQQTGCFKNGQNETERKKPVLNWAKVSSSWDLASLQFRDLTHIT